MTVPITVIIPAYGRGLHLEEVVTSLELQLDAESRIIISHSGDDDPTDRFSGDPRVRVLHSDERLFAGAARNRGTALADSDWLAFVDEDVVPAEDWYASLLRAIERGDSDCIVGSIGYQTSGGYWGISLWFLEFGACHPYLAPGRVHGGGSCNMAVKRETFESIGGFPEDWRIGEDSIAHARLTSAGQMPMFEPDVLVRHHNPSGAGHLLRHLFHYGRYSARVRRDHPNLPGASAIHWPVLAPGIYLARAVQITGRVMRAKRAPKMQFIVHLPGILAGLAAWSFGFAREAFQPNFSTNEY
jgi:GT2 family glycosyltransferase